MLQPLSLTDVDSSTFVEFLGSKFPVVYLTAGDSFPTLKETNLYGFDIETYKTYDHKKAGLDPHMSGIRLLQIFDGETAYVIDWKSFEIGMRNEGGNGGELFPIVCWEFEESLRKFLINNNLIAHNAVFEIMHIKHNFDIDIKCECTMLLEQLYLGTKLPIPESEDDTEDSIPDDGDGLAKTRFHGVSLEACVARHFNVALDKSEQGSDWGVEELTGSQISYAALDAVAAFFLVRSSTKLLLKYDQVKAYKLQRDCLFPIAMMQLEGFPIDWEAHAEAIKSWETELEERRTECRKYFGEINLQSSKQLGLWLIQNGGELVACWPRTKKGALSFSSNSLLDFLDNPAINALFSTKKLTKLVNAFGKGLVGHKHPLTGRIHASYNIGKAGTGRMTCSDPNLQQQPRDKEFRSLYVAPPGYVMVVSDFSQIELRLQAEFSKDPFMNKVYEEGRDIYTATAAELFNVPEAEVSKDQRHFGKTIMLSLGYGMGPTKLRAYAKYSAKPSIVMSEEEARIFHTKYHKTVSDYSNWCQKTRLISEEKDYIVRTIFGKIRKLKPEFVFTQAPNTIIQGSAAELMMLALTNLYHAIKGTTYKIIGVIHDEIVALSEIGKENTLQELIERAMNDAMKMCFPNAVNHHVAQAHSGYNWAEAK